MASPLVLRLLCLLVAVLAPFILLAQNVDVNAERVSMDNAMLRTLDGTASALSSSVWPAYIGNVDTTASNAFSTYSLNYYWPLVAQRPDTTQVFTSSHGRYRGLVFNDAVARVQGDLGFMLRPGTTSNEGSSESFMLGRASARVMGSLGSNLGFFLDLSNGSRLRGSASRIAQTDPTLGRTLKFTIEDSAFFDRYIGYVQYQSEYLRIRYGREALQFGNSPIDNLVHSMNAPLLDGLLLDVPYKSVRFTMTHSAANGLDTSGKAVPGKYIATHRIAVEPTSWLSVGLNDMIVYWGRGLDLAYLNPLAFFVSAGLSTQERNQNDNSLIGADITLRPVKGLMLYGSLIVDDLSYTSLGDTSIAGNNNKFAYQLGLSKSFGQEGAASRIMVSAEYARIDPFTYSHRSINASYTSFGAPVGYDMQSNSDRLALQLRYWLTPRTYVRVDADYTRHGENLLDANGNLIMGEDPRYPGSGIQVPIGNVGGDILRGDGDFLYGNAFLRGNVSHQRRLRLWFSAEWANNIFTDLNIGYTNRNSGNNPTNFFFGALEIRVGY